MAEAVGKSYLRLVYDSTSMVEVDDVPRNDSGAASELEIATPAQLSFPFMADACFHLFDDRYYNKNIFIEKISSLYFDVIIDFRPFPYFDDLFGSRKNAFRFFQERNILYVDMGDVYRDISDFWNDDGEIDRLLGVSSSAKYFALLFESRQDTEISSKRIIKKGKYQVSSF